MKKELDTIPSKIPAAIVIKFRDDKTFTIHSNSIAIKENIEAVCDKIENHPAYIDNEKVCLKQIGESLECPKGPVNKMKFKETKAFVIKMMNDIATLSGRRLYYNKPEYKPEWWPNNIRWDTQCIQRDIKLEQLKNVITACFSYYGITLDH